MNNYFFGSYFEKYRNENNEDTHSDNYKFQISSNIEGD